MAEDFDIELLGQLPLDASIREQTDSGSPTVVSAPDSPQADSYRSAARRMAAQLAMKGKDFSHRFPPIIVEGVG
jgi:ATP-binding protein involved in chromosome partitioning